MIIAVFGSREGVDREKVEEYLDPRYDPNIILTSGGAKGVDTWAEQYWINRGGRVLSFRPIQLTEESYGVQVWKLGSWPEGQSISTLRYPHYPTWRRYEGALAYRSMLVADAAHRGVAFRANRSRGTGFTIWCFEAEGKTCVVKEDDHEPVTE